MKKQIITMKPFQLVAFAIFVLICLGLMGCQSNTTNCQATVDPFPILDTPETWTIYFGPNIKVDQVCSFTGQVSRGQTYKHQITQDLVFCLFPSNFFNGTDTGWIMKIGTAMENNCGDDLGDIANPPVHGNLLFFIHGWQYRNKDNTGESIDSHNPLKYKKQFQFLLNENYYKEASRYYVCLYPASDCTKSDPSANKIDITKIPRSVGIVTITDLKLGNLIPNQLAWIDHMNFEVKIYLPLE